jgi:hypothetical protein
MSGAPFGGGQTWRPLADVSETDDGYVVEVEVPGVAREDLDITLSANELEISGEFVEKKRAGWLRTRSRTRRTGSFEFRTLLARDVDADKITATLAECSHRHHPEDRKRPIAAHRGHHRLTFRRRSRRPPGHRERWHPRHGPSGDGRSRVPRRSASPRECCSSWR